MYGESMGKPCSCIVDKKPCFVLQVMQESVSGKKYHSFVAIGIVTRAATGNNTDGNKLVIFSGIALYYGDNYIKSQKSFLNENKRM